MKKNSSIKPVMIEKGERCGVPLLLFAGFPGKCWFTMAQSTGIPAPDNINTALKPVLILI